MYYFFFEVKNLKKIHFFHIFSNIVNIGKNVSKCSNSLLEVVPIGGVGLKVEGVFFEVEVRKSLLLYIVGIILR